MQALATSVKVIAAQTDIAALSLATTDCCQFKFRPLYSQQPPQAV